jgi:hypothetical protein
MLVSVGCIIRLAQITKYPVSNYQNSWSCSRNEVIDTRTFILSYKLLLINLFNLLRLFIYFLLTGYCNVFKILLISTNHSLEGYAYLSHKSRKCENYLQISDAIIFIGHSMTTVPTKLKPSTFRIQCTHTTAQQTLEGAIHYFSTRNHVFKESWGSFPGVKRQAPEVNHSPATCAHVKNKWSYTSTPPLFRLRGIERKNFTFTWERVPKRNL